MAVEAVEADAMIEAAERNGRILAVNFQQRFRPEIVAARELIRSGALGELHRVELVEPWMRPAAYYRSAGWRGTWRGEGGGVLLNQAPHGLDLLCHLAGMPNRWWHGRRRCVAIETEDTLLAMVEYERARQTITSARQAGAERSSVRAGIQIEENGTLRFDRFETDLRDHIEPPICMLRRQWKSRRAHPRGQGRSCRGVCAA